MQHRGHMCKKISDRCQTPHPPCAPRQVEVAHKYSTADTLRQQYLFVPAKYKDCYLAFILNELSGCTGMVGGPGGRGAGAAGKRACACTLQPEGQGLRGAARPCGCEGWPAGVCQRHLCDRQITWHWRPVQAPLGCALCHCCAPCTLPASPPQIFTRTCDSTRKIALMLRNLGFGAVPIHGQMSQPKRLGALNKFKAGERRILVATDVAARGLDIPSVDVVINYDVPSNSKDYVHR